MDPEHKSKDEMASEIHTLQQQIKDLELQISGKKEGQRSKTTGTAARSPQEEFPLSENIEKTILANLNHGVLLQDSSGKIIATNKSAQDILGLSKVQLSNSNPLSWDWKAIYRDGSPFPLEEYPAFVSLKTGKKHQNVIIGLCKPDNSLIWLAINSIPLKKEGAKKAYAVISTFTDISEFIAAEQELLKSEEKHRIISAILSDYIYSVNKSDMTLDWVSGAFKKITGYTVDEINKLPEKWVSVLYPDDSKVISEKIIKDVQNKKVSSYDIRIIRKDGKIRWINDKISAVYDENDQPVRLYGAVRDITEQKKAEKTLLESEKQLSVIFNNSSDMQILFSVGVDSDFRVVNVNDTCIKQLRKIK